MQKFAYFNIDRRGKVKIGGFDLVEIAVIAAICLGTIYATKNVPFLKGIV